MSEIADAFLTKARESLAGAASEFADGRYNNCANRCYCACFHAGIAALDLAGIRPTEGRAEWGHAFVQSQFVGQLVHRRKLYSSDLRDTIALTLSVREQADYRLASVSQTQASRTLSRARTFVSAVAAQGESSS